MLQEFAPDDEDKEEDASSEEMTGREADKYQEGREGDSKNFFESDSASEVTGRLKGEEDRIDAEITKKEQEDPEDK